MRKPWVFVCSRYRAETLEDMEANVARAEELCFAVAEAGGVPMAPHLYFTEFLDDDVPEEREAGIALGVEWLRRCNMMLVDGRWGVSEGMEREIALDKLRRGRQYFLTDGNAVEELQRLAGDIAAFNEMFHVKHEKEAK